MGKNIINYLSCRGLAFKLYKELKTLNIKKVIAIITQFKMGYFTKQRFLEVWNTNETLNKNCNIFWDQGNASSNYFEISFYPIWMTKINKTNYDSTCWWRCKKKETCSLLLRVQTGTVITENSVEVTCYDSSVTSLGIYPKDCISYYRELAYPCSLLLYS